MSAAHFIDTSALIKRYIAEAGGAALQARCFADKKAEIVTSALTYAEMHATLARLVRDGALTVQEHEAIVTSFETDWSTFVVVEFGPNVRRLVPELARTHTLRGADLVQLASAVYMRASQAMSLFVACDIALANAAALVNLPVFNPEVA